ncbi:23S rRNA (uracil(1939)-C(5))-methyltransferase RlmD [Bacillus sp. FSL W7-1360]
MNGKNMRPEKGQTIPLKVKRLGINGEGMGYYKRHVVFVKGALPGEDIICEITKAHEKFFEAKVEKIRKHSRERVKPPCPIYEKCGGCQLQHMTYAASLRAKKEIVRQAFARYTKMDARTLPLHDTIGMEDPWYYRNKSQLQARTEKGKVVAGLYKENSHQLVDLSACMVQHRTLNEVTQVVKDILTTLKIPTYDEKKHRGDVRTIVTRIGFETGQVQLVLVTTREAFSKKTAFIEEVRRRLPEVTSLVQNVNHKRTSLIFGEEMIHLEGEKTIEERLGEHAFSLSAQAFFQLNPVQTVHLYNAAKKCARLTGEEKIVDAYCGVGTIGQWLASDAAEVRGMDVTKAAIVDARKKAAQMHINARYEVGTAETWLPRWVKEGFRPDVIVVDPPRTGCDEKLLKAVLQVKPERFVYVSCNPSTLAKDVAKLTARGHYEVTSIQPVDMFPWTAHVETVVLMSRVEK